MKPNNNIFSSTKNKLTSGLPEGSICVIPGDNPDLYVYNSAGRPVSIKQTQLVLTQAEYDALETVDPTIMYLIKEEEE